MPTPTFECSCCGKSLPGPPLSWHFEAPAIWYSIPTDEVPERGQLGSEQCVIDYEHFFVRGLIEIPVIDGGGPFAWEVWVSLSESNFRRATELWNDSDRVNEPAYFGWLCNSIPVYPEMLHVKTMVHSRAGGVRPFIELEPTDHPLSIEQRNGITTQRVREIAERMYHHLDSKGPE